jgi:hypothetical protein
MPTAKKAVLNVSDLAAMLASGDATVKSTNANPDIEIDAAVSWAGASRLTLASYHSIAFNKPVVVAGSGALTITTNAGGTNGDYRFFGRGHVDFWDLNSNLSINGHDYLLVHNIDQIKKYAKRGQDPWLALAKSFDASKQGTYSNPIFKFSPSVFEGLGNTIQNLSISGRSNESVSFFPFSPTVRDFGLVNIDIEAGDTSCVGALEATNDGIILNSFATGHISVGKNSVAGGLVCGNFFQVLLGNITQSYANVDISGGDGSILGGLVGGNVATCTIYCRSNGHIDRSYAFGSVSGGNGATVGGLVGENHGGFISNSYAFGMVTGDDNSFVGGLVGLNADLIDEEATPAISDSYSAGIALGGSGASVGGLIGQDATDAQNTNLYWDFDTSGITNSSQGAGNIANDPGITGLTDAELKSALPDGFDKKVWKQKSSVNNGYPYLVDNPPPQ